MGDLEPSCGRPGASWERLGGVWEASWTSLGRLGSVLEASWRRLGGEDREMARKGHLKAPKYNFY